MAHNDYIRTGALWTDLSALDASEMHDFDVRQFQSINGDLGGSYAPSSLLIIGGFVGLRVTAPFSADDASISISNTKTLTLLGGATLLALGGSIITMSASSVFDALFSSATRFRGTVTYFDTSTTNVNSAAAFQFDAGSLLTINGSILGAPTVISGATFTFASGSTTNLAGATNITSTGTLTCAVGGNIAMNGTCTSNGTTTFANGSTTTFASGAGLTLNNSVTGASGSSIAMAGDITLSSTCSLIRSGPETLSGNGAYRNVRIVAGAAADTTYDARQFDVLKVPATAAAQIYTMADLDPADRVVAWIERYRTSTAHQLFLKRADNSVIATFDADVAGGSVQIEWDGASWALLSISGTVSP